MLSKHEKTKGCTRLSVQSHTSSDLDRTADVAIDSLELEHVVYNF